MGALAPVRRVIWCDLASATFKDGKLGDALHNGNGLSCAPPRSKSGHSFFLFFKRATPPSQLDPLSIIIHSSTSSQNHFYQTHLITTPLPSYQPLSQTNITFKTITMAKVYAHESFEDFLTNGYELTILDPTGEKQDCCICLKPIYKPECDGTESTHNHGTSCPQPNPVPKSPFTSDGEIPEIGMKILACGHEIGHQCALEHFQKAVYGSCPLCRISLFRTEKDDDDEEMA